MSGLWKHLLKELLLLPPTFFMILTIIFLIIHLSPGDPVQTFLAGAPGMEYDPRLRTEAIRRLGLDLPVYLRYFKWLSQVLSGDLGHSYMLNTPVAEQIARAIPITLTFVGLGYSVAIGLSLIMGTLSALHHNTRKDNILVGFAAFFYSLPKFWFALLMMLLFSIYLGWLPTHGLGGMIRDLTWWERAKYWILPVFTLGLTEYGFLQRLIRANMLNVLGKDFVLMARAKGLPERTVVYKHVLRNALLAPLAAMSLRLAQLFGTTAVLEKVFAIPGLGALLVEAGLARDYPMIMGICIVVAIVVLLTMALVDLIYGIVDPRVRYE